MYREVSRNNTTFLEVFNVHFLFKRFLDDRLDLASVELIKHVTSIALEWHHTVILRQSALDAEDLTHKVDY